MRSITNRTAVLAFSRLARVGVQLLGPLILVRLLTVEQYGEYRDFFLYVALLQPWIQLNINNSLAYFVPKEPENERLYLSQAGFMVLVSSTVTAILLLLFARHLPSVAVQAYAVPLCLYLLFVNNLDAWEVYWVAKRQTLIVLYYSVVRLTLRLIVVASVAYVTRSVSTIIWALVIFEALRLSVLGVYGVKHRLLTARFKTEALKSQIAFIVPLSVALVVFSLNNYLGQLLVSVELGVTALAVYSVGSYAYPFIGIFRSSLSDVIMPEIVSQRDMPTNQALRLWQRSTVAICAVMFPLALLLFYYADVVITTLFTSSYAAATPVFQILTLALIRHCFDFGLPIRVVKRTGVVLINSVTILVVNVVFLWALFDSLGILAPAVATIVAAIVGAINMGYYVVKHCGFSVSNLLPWNEIGKVALASLVCIPILYAGEILGVAPVVRAMLGASGYLCCYGVLLHFCRIPEITRMMRRLLPV